MSLPMRGEWIEISTNILIILKRMSLPMRGEWIEITIVPPATVSPNVSPHAGRVD